MHYIYNVPLVHLVKRQKKKNMGSCLHSHRVTTASAAKIMRKTSQTLYKSVGEKCLVLRLTEYNVLMFIFVN